MLISMTVLGLPFVWFLGSKVLSWLWVHDNYAEYAAMLVYLRDKFVKPTHVNVLFSQGSRGNGIFRTYRDAL